MTTALKKLLSEVKEKTTRIAQLDAQLNDLQKQKDALLDAPLSLSDYRAVLARVVAACAASVQDSYAFISLVSGSMGAPRENLVSWRDRKDKAPAIAMVAHLNDCPAFSLLCWLDQEKVIDALYSTTMRIVGDQWGNEDQVPVAEREGMLQSLDAIAEPLRKESERLTRQVKEITDAVGGAGV